MAGSAGTDDLVGLYDLAREWESYPRLLEGLCQRAGVPITIGPNGRRARLIARSDVKRLRAFWASYRSFRGSSKGKGHHWHPIV